MRAETPASILPTLARAASGQMVVACLLSLIGGVASTSVVVLINAVLHDSGTMRIGSLVSFAILAATACIVRSAARVLFSNLGQRSLANMRRAIAVRVQQASLVDLEAVGSQRIQSLVTNDANQIANLIVGLPILITNAMIVCATLAYLAYLSAPLFLCTLVVILLGSGVYLAFQKSVWTHLTTAGQEQDRVFGHFSAIALGAKELRLNREKAGRIFDEVLCAAIDSFAHHRGRGIAILSLASGWGEFLFYALLGTVLYWPTFAARDPGTTSGYVIAFFYIMGPLEALLDFLPLFGLARVAARRIDSTFAELAAEAVGPSGKTSDTATIALTGVSRRSCERRTGASFDLGPIDLMLHPGQITFLTGGNGCGKTTLARIVAGLYVPDNGNLALNGNVIDENCRSVYRQHISAVFSDFYLFETFLERRSPELNQLAQDWLRRLGLDHNVSIDGGAFSTQSLSTGQRKRLALIVACLENRPVMIFDEWAADQDPIFRRFFYEAILPDLRARGKTLLVITHDDRYFGQADQLLKLDGGVIVERSVGAAGA